MYIERSGDNNYPFTISNSWGEEVSCTLKDLRELKKLINEVLREEKERKTK